MTKTTCPIMCRVGQNRIYTPYIIVYLVVSLPKIPYIHRIYMVLVNPNNVVCVRARQLAFPPHVRAL